MGSFCVELSGQQRVIDNLEESTSLGEFLERIRSAFQIVESEFYKYRLLAWKPVIGVSAADIKNLVDPAQSLGYVRAEFMLAWGSTLHLDRALR